MLHSNASLSIGPVLSRMEPYRSFGSADAVTASVEIDHAAIQHRKASSGAGPAAAYDGQVAETKMSVCAADFAVRCFYPRSGSCMVFVPVAESLSCQS